VASSPLFEYYPLGFLALLEYASRFGYEVRIINLAVKMAKSGRFSARRLIRKLKPLLFGIDLHWMVHANGAFDLARICKEEHPDIPVVFGGLTASYYHREIIESPDVDYVLRGDSTEQPVVDLLRALEARLEPSGVANLTWKRGRGLGQARDGDRELHEPRAQIIVNPLTYQPDLLDIRIDYRRLIKHMLRYRDLRGGLLTGYQWPSYAFNMTLSCRGCLHTCLTCGGSNWALGRSALAVRDPEALAREIISIQQLATSEVGVVGDIRQHEPDRLIAELRRLKPTRPLSLELFGAGGEDFLRKLASIGPPLDIHMSPESHDERLRARLGRLFANEQLEADLDFILAGGGNALLFFVVGIPGQTRESVMESVAYARQLLERYNGRYPRKLDVMFSPLLPFIDPGSPAFEHPEKTGYRLFARTLAEHRELLRKPDLRDVLNYETDTLTRAEIIGIGAEVMEKIADVREQCGVLTRKWAERERAKYREAGTGRATDRPA
jgi:B12-binding domain/radical SAM domain protein